MIGLYCFSRPDQMVGHNFKDDVAITFAFSCKGAIKRFSTLYQDVRESEVKRIRLFGNVKVIILTDY